MKKLLITFGFLVAIIIISPSLSRAQMMGVTTNVQNSQTLQEEASGKAIFDKLQASTTSCSNLSDGDFELLGDYFMGRMMGNAHSTMDALMTQRLGTDTNRLMHVALGKRLSSCDATAAFPSQGAGFLPMMGMMGDWSSLNNNYQPNSFTSMMGNYSWPMMSGYYGGFGWVFMILWWALIIIGIVMLARWASGSSRMSGHTRERTALDVLKDRYAKGEIDKKEFEEKKSDLST